MDPLVLDLAIVLVLLGAAVSGWRSGLITSALSVAGLVGGAALAMSVLPPLLQDVPALQRSLPLRVGVLSLSVLVVATVCQVVLGTVGGQLRAHARHRPTEVVDSVAGTLAAVVVSASLLWFVGDTVRNAAPGEVARTVAGSAVLRGIDRVMPPALGRAFAGFRRQVEASEYPRVFEGLAAEPIPPAQPPDPRVARTAGVVAAGRSVVKVVGDASACSREQDGSGWVVAPGTVVTNAHVVAGTSDLWVQPGGKGRRYRGQVVAFDPEVDVAVVRVPDLPAPALRVVDSIGPREDAVVAGFPLGGPYHLGAARVRSVMAARGADIYGGTGVVRQVYSVYGTVRPGNSGGPLLTTDGRVAGTIFASSVDDAATGYALTTAATRTVVEQGTRATRPVPTGPCSTR